MQLLSLLFLLRHCRYTRHCFRACSELIDAPPVIWALTIRDDATCRCTRGNERTLVSPGGDDAEI